MWWWSCYCRSWNLSKSATTSAFVSRLKKVCNTEKEEDNDNNNIDDNDDDIENNIVCNNNVTMVMMVMTPFLKNGFHFRSRSWACIAQEGEKRAKEEK